MSFNIPIIFDDAPFFKWGDIRPSRERRNFRSGDRRHPSLFEQWSEPEYFFDYPTQKPRYGQNYRGRPTEGEYQMREMPEEDRFEDEEGTQGDIYDTEEHRRVRGAPMGNGWDIPVQHVNKSTRAHHKHKHMPKHKSGKTQQNKSNDSKENLHPKSQRNINKENQTQETPYKITEVKPKPGNNAESTEIEPDKNSNVVIPSNENMKRQSVDESNPGTSQAADDNQNIEIPIAYSPPKNARRRLSKRLSQCDPPSAGDIKIARIKSIVEKTEGLEEKIAAFNDPVQSKNFLYISETLMRILLDLDTVDSEGIDIVRNARKEGVRTVQALVDKLENKLEENKQNSAKK